MMKWFVYISAASGADFHVNNDQGMFQPGTSVLATLKTHGVCCEMPGVITIAVSMLEVR